MLRAIWTKVNLATTVSVLELSASSSQSSLQAVVTQNAFQPFQLNDDTFFAVDTLSLNFGLAPLAEATVINDAVSVTAALVVSDSILVGYDLLDNFSANFQMGQVDDFSFSDNVSISVGFASSLTDSMGLADVCLQFLSSGSSSSVFNESIINSSNFNA
jgi:hypothetical protein